LSEREIDWRRFLDSLVFCYGCGRFGLPARGQPSPKGWTLLYQPHADAPSGLPVCSEQCVKDVRAALVAGPVTAPLRMATDVPMPAELRRMMLDEAMQHAIDGGRVDDLFLAAIEDGKKVE
jgi:hypothetical protein